MVCGSYSGWADDVGSVGYRAVVPSVGSDCYDVVGADVAVAVAVGAVCLFPGLEGS